MADDAENLDGGLDEFEDEASERWRPPGSETFYRVDIQWSPGQVVRGSITVTQHEEIDLPSLVVSRIGGPNNRDREFRAQLYPFIGAATVAGGQIEANMKRLILILEENTVAKFGSVELPWSGLHKRLRRAAEAAARKDEAATLKPPPPGFDSFPSAVLSTLDVAEQEDIKAVRDHIVHASWWDFADAGLHRSRFYLDGKSELQRLDWAKMRRDVVILDRYARRLDDLVSRRWLGFFLPRDPD